MSRKRLGLHPGQVRVLGLLNARDVGGPGRMEMFLMEMLTNKLSPNAVHEEVSLILHVKKL